jgi:hypothetical protein
MNTDSPTSAAVIELPFERVSGLAAIGGPDNSGQSELGIDEPRGGESTPRMQPLSGE